MFARRMGEQAELHPLDPSQAEEFAAHLDRAREHIRPWVGPAFVTDTIDGARQTLGRYSASAADDGGRLFGIRRGGRLVGGVMFVSFRAASGQCEIGCWLEPSAEGHGLVTGACRELLRYAFEERGMHRVEWHCRADNGRSAAVAQRLGMTLEGTLRGSWSYAGSFHDTQIWAILSDEYRAARPRGT